MRIAALYLILAAVAAASGPAAAQTAPPNDPEAADLVATQLRQQGYACDDPYGATREKDAAAGVDAVWRIECKNAIYRVRLIPDQAADVEEIQSAQ